MKIRTEDKIVQAVLRKMDERSLIGQKKYGATMMQEIEGQKKDLNRFLVDVQEELMDALLYIEAAKRCLTDEIEEAMLKSIASGKFGYDSISDIEITEMVHKNYDDSISDIEVNDEEIL